MAEIASIPLHLIEASPHNPRQSFNVNSLAYLAASIGRHGVLHPVLLTKAETEGRYRLVAGERRVRAARLARQEQIPALVVQLSEADLREVQLAENLEREQLTVIDEAEAYGRLKSELGYTDAKIAQRMRRSLTYVRSRLSLLKLCLPAREVVATGGVGLGAAVAISRIADPADQGRLASLAQQGQWSAAQTSDYISRQEIRRRADRTRILRRENLEKKRQSLEAGGCHVVAPELFDSARHHRVWDLAFSECGSCRQKGLYLRLDGQTEDLCVEPRCFVRLREQRRSGLTTAREDARRQRLEAFRCVLSSEQVTTEHLRYVLWTQLCLLGPAAEGWAREFTKDEDAAESGYRATEWQTVSRLDDADLLTQIMRLTVSYIAQSGNRALPSGLRDSLNRCFGVPESMLAPAPGSGLQ